LSKLIAASALLISVSAATANAQGYGFFKSNVSQFGGPVLLTMQHSGGAYRLKSATTMVPISYEAGYKGTFSYLENIDVRVEHILKGKGSVHGLRRNLAKKDTVWGNANLQMTRAHLAPMEKLGQELCASHNGPGTKNINTIIPLTMTVAYYDNQNVHAFRRNGDVPAVIVCEPRAPARVAITQMKLYTIPARPVCGKPVVLMAEFHTASAGKIDFQLQRGDGEKQNATIVTCRVGNGFFERWSKTYTFAKSESRRYRVVPIGYTLSTNWVDLDVQCGLGRDTKRPGGFAK
jgi:hypothetical protein